MRITISKIYNINGSLIVDFLSEYGSGQATWIGPSPTMDRQYHVELSCDDELELGVNCFKIAGKDEKPSISLHESLMSIVAEVNDVFDDQTASLRLGDSVVLIDFLGTLPEKGSWLKVSPTQFEVSDTNV